MKTQKTRMHNMALLGSMRPFPTSPGVHEVQSTGEVVEREPGTKPREIYDPVVSTEERQANKDQSAIDSIVQAIDQVDPNDTELWTKNKGPKVSAIEALLGKPITEAERDTAWQQYSERG
ncbi:MAG: hypothetical protein P1V33_03505 [Pseudohongiella nitratireducens]|nr:hypothetical protein [Pseudohongiella nitratireducens]MDF1622521.1 hypothetical protein [Pseudohongiella nitratireducens]